MTAVNALLPNQLFRAMHIAGTCGINVMVYGEPGIGKTSIAKQVGAALRYKVYLLPVPNMEPTDINGLPFLQDGNSVYAPWDWFPSENENIVYILDDLPQAQPTTFPALSSFLNERTISGSRKLPNNTVIFATGNEKHQKTGARDLPSHIANRMMHLWLVPDLTCMIKASMASADDVMLSRAKPSKSRLDNLIIAYLKTMPDNLQTRDKNKTDDPAFASPRTWALLSRIMPYVISDSERDLRSAFVCGLLGDGVGTNFCNFLNDLDLNFDVQEVFANPEKYPIPTGSAKALGKRYAIVGALASGVKSMDLASKYFKFVARLPKDEGASAYSLLRSLNEDTQKKIGERYVDVPECKKLLPEFLDYILM